MPSLRSEASGWPLGEILLLLGATAALVVLLARSPGIAGTNETAPALFIALPLVALFGAHLARRIRSHCLHMSVFMAAAAVAAFKFVVAGESAVAGMLWIMVLGMTAGMWAGWWIAEWMIRGWRLSFAHSDAAAM